MSHVYELVLLIVAVGVTSDSCSIVNGYSIEFGYGMVIPV